MRADVRCAVRVLGLFWLIYRLCVYTYMNMLRRERKSPEPLSSSSAVQAMLVFVFFFLLRSSCLPSYRFKSPALKTIWRARC